MASLVVRVRITGVASGRPAILYFRYSMTAKNDQQGIDRPMHHSLRTFGEAAWCKICPWPAWLAARSARLQAVGVGLDEVPRRNRAVASRMGECEDQDLYQESDEKQRLQL